MTFPDTNAPERTNVHFDEMRDEDHHTGISPLLRLKLGMVSMFPLDYMHLVCLGVMRRLINCWIRGPPGGRIQITVLKAVSAVLATMRTNLPREFVRKPRSLLELRLWKATELRQFLLYTGPVVLYGKIPTRIYRNFMLLSVAMRIILSPSMSVKYCDYVEKILIVFVNNFATIYGDDMIVYNVHNLIHIVQDVRNYGALDNVSAFPFENFLGQIKRMVRRPQNPLSQIVRRIREKDQRDEQQGQKTRESGTAHKQSHFSGPLPREYMTYAQYHQYKGEDFVSCSEGDNCFLVNGRFSLVRNILRSPAGDTNIVIERFEKADPFFEYPLNSMSLNISTVSKTSDRLIVVPLADLSCKCILLQFRQAFVAMPMLHRSSMYA